MHLPRNFGELFLVSVDIRCFAFFLGREGMGLSVLSVSFFRIGAPLVLIVVIDGVIVEFEFERVGGGVITEDLL